MARKFFPQTAEQLIEHMERRFPERDLQPGRDAPEDIWFRAGQRSVVRQMRYEFDTATRRKDGV